MCYSYKRVTCKAKKDKNKPNLTEKTKHIRMNLSASKRFCFASALLPFGAIGDTNAHCTHLQIAQAIPDRNLQKSAIFTIP